MTTNRFTCVKFYKKNIKQILIQVGFLCIFLTISFVIPVHANNATGTFDTEKKWAMQQSLHALSDANKTQLSSMVSEVNQTPAEESYYTTLTNADSGTLDNAARLAQQNDAQAKSTLDSILSRPVLTIDENSDLVRQSKIIEKNAKDIATSRSDNDHCVIQWVQKTCQTPIRMIQNNCTKTPAVLIEQTTIQKNESFSGNIPAQTLRQGTLTVPFDGVITQFSVTLKSNDIWLCHSTYQGKLDNTLISQRQVNCGHYLGDLSFSNKKLSISVKKNQPITFVLVGTAYGKWRIATYELTMMADETQKTATITWKEKCHAS
jgi:hypothetical protein